jgi:hypothetical protein
MSNRHSHTGPPSVDETQGSRADGESSSGDQSSLGDQASPASSSHSLALRDGFLDKRATHHVYPPWRATAFLIVTAVD